MSSLPARPRAAGDGVYCLVAGAGRRPSSVAYDEVEMDGGVLSTDRSLFLDVQLAPSGRHDRIFDR